MQRWYPLPAGVYGLVERTPGAVLLESAPSGGAEARSRLFLSPERILMASDSASLDGLFREIESAVQRGHFAAGYFSYECGECFEPKAALRPSLPGQPLAWFGIYPRCHTFPLRFEADSSPATLYAALRARQPVDFGAFLHCESGRWILSFSPELFFRTDEEVGKRRIITRPMKGTARRGRTTAEDRSLAEWLRHDAKNRSENVMIVDLLRNDLGRLCQFGSVLVDELFAVERHPSLWQMTSTVSGELRPGVSYRDIFRALFPSGSVTGARDIFRALFPSGSVTGAPKVRAMQLLARLEEEPRGVYTGAIGFFSHEQTVFNVAIRTIELNGAQGRMGVGSGIVIDSVAADEFRECALKAQFLTHSTEPFSLIETMLWDGDYPLLELHLDRLQDSADYFDFGCDRVAIKARLMRVAEGFGDALPRRMRLTLAADGEVHIGHEALCVESPALKEPLRVYIAAQRTDATDRFLFHKTTNRAVYAEAFNAARHAGFEDVIFLNEDGQVTEGAISNIFKSADSVYLSNAVRGLRRVVIDWEYAGAENASGS